MIGLEATDNLMVCAFTLRDSRSAKLDFLTILHFHHSQYYREYDIENLTQAVDTGS